MKLYELGERGLIQRSLSNLMIKQDIDDCATISRGKYFELITTDSINQQTHMPVGASPENMGRFFGAVNLSDIAAMGGIPEYFMAAFNIPSSLDIDFIDKFESGLNEILQRYRVEYLGGDSKESPAISFTGICIGKVLKTNALRRSNIKKGQILCVTNTIGKKISAYIAYKSGIRTRENANEIMSIEPRIKEGEIISKNGGRFMMDLSDGLGSSILQMKKNYGLGFRIVRDQIPIHNHLFHVCQIAGIDPYNAILDYGGDYELLFSIDNEGSEETAARLRSNGINFSMIGDVWEGENILFDGERWNPVSSIGYEHFRKID